MEPGRRRAASAPATGWRRAPFRASIQVTIDGVAHPEEDIFTGLLAARRPGVSGPTFEAEGAEGFIKRATVRTALLEYVPLATATTLTSVEDPESPACQSGVLNRIFWLSGGRPYAQAASYPGARFYYACDGTSVAPEYSWIDGDNAWDEALKLAGDAGGQIYQDSRGVMRYVNPLSLAEAERYLPDLLTELEEIIEEAGLRHDAITIRMTGCPNGCARPYISEIGFVGRSPGCYNVYLGGGFAGQRLSKLYRENHPGTEIKDLLAPIIKHYAKDRNEGERFGDFCIRAGYVAATEQGKDFHKNVLAEAHA